MAITQGDLTAAIKQFEEGQRPYHFTEAQSWYVVGDNGKLYPLKYLYALIINDEPASFHTNTARREFENVGIEVRRVPKNEEDDFYRKVQESRKNAGARRARLKKANRSPEQKLQQIIVYERNPDVVAEVLERANGNCEECGKPAPFERRKDKSPYLEVHHKVPLANQGLDTVDNAEALCPNCHRKRHYG